MGKCYLIANIRARDHKLFRALTDVVPAAVSKFRGRILVMMHSPDLRKGSKDAKDARTLLVEFDDLAAARSFYESSEYQQTIKLSKGCSVVDVQIVEGLDEISLVPRVTPEPLLEAKGTPQSEDDLVDLYRHHSRKEGIEGG